MRINLINLQYSIRIIRYAKISTQIKIIYRTGELKDDGILNLATHENVELKHTVNLHAKCYFNEKEMIITSFNLLESSEKNWEMGILVKRNTDKEMFEKAMGDVHIIFKNSNPHAIPKPQAPAGSPEKNKLKSIEKVNTHEGFCIRCGDDITFNIERPLCRECYKSWNEWGDTEYEENFCHFSGKESDGETSFDRPILNEYWKEAKKAHGL